MLWTDCSSPARKVTGNISLGCPVIGVQKFTCAITCLFLGIYHQEQVHPRGKYIQTNAITRRCSFDLQDITSRIKIHAKFKVRRTCIQAIGVRGRKTHLVPRAPPPRTSIRLCVRTVPLTFSTKRAMTLLFKHWLCQMNPVLPRPTCTHTYCF